ncbi:MAG: hypothetical protein RLZZ324_393 [Candidatus Parcubacteria bacterium]|jgi:endonuclease/exonuclease/phosphatase family metal-dependent hydrolase
MRIITLNTWGGRALHPLLDFFRRHAATTDVFCLQEVLETNQLHVEERHPEEHVRWDLFTQIRKQLPGFEGSFAAYDDDPNRMSQAIFFRGDLPVKTIADSIVYKPETMIEHGSYVITPRKIQSITVEHGGKELMIANFHGLWNGGPKTDAPERLEQSRRVKEYLDMHEGPAVLCGDFNLLPDTESLAIMAEGMRDLVRESGVTSTRTPLYRHHDDPETPKFADYILLSPELAVKEFEVMKDVASDHAALRVVLE